MLRYVCVLCSVLTLPAWAQPQPGEVAQSITDLKTIVNSPNPSSLAGQRVRLSDATVARVLSERVVLLSAGKGQQVVARLNETMRLQNGQRIAVDGVINQMPTQLQAWDLKGEVAKQAQGHSVFINVNKAKLLEKRSPASPGAPGSGMRSRDSQNKTQ